MTDSSLYSFSDDFMNIISQALERPVDEQQSSEDQPSDNPDYQSSIDDLSSKYDEQAALIEQLQSQLSDFQNQQTSSQEPNYVAPSYEEDDPNYWIDFVKKNVLDDNTDSQDNESWDNSSLTSDENYAPKTGNFNTTGTNAERHNNPGNIKYAPWEQSFGAVKGESAPDGGNYAYFPDPQNGLKAQQSLIKGKTYSDKTVDQAMRLYSNNGYDGSIYPEIKDKKISDLTNQELNELTKRQLVHEDINYATKLGIKKYGGF